MSDLVVGFCGGVCAVHLFGLAELPPAVLLVAATVSVAVGLQSRGW